MRQTANALSVRGLILPAIGEFRRYLGSFVVFGVFFAILNWLVLAPTFAFLFTIMVRWGGGRVVSNEEILDFFLSPIGVAAILLLIVAVLTTMMTQQAGLMILYANLRMQRPTGSVRALLAMLLKLPGILLINVVRAILLVLVLLPFASAGAWVYFRFLRAYDLNFLVQTRPAVFWWASAGAVLLIVAAVLCVLTVHTRVLFAFPAYFFGGYSPTAAMRRSYLLARGHTVPLLRLFIVWLAFAGLLNFALNSALAQLGPAIVPLAGNRIAITIVVTGVVLALRAFAHAALNLFTLGVQAIVVTRAYTAVSADDRLAIPAETLARDPHHRRVRWILGGVVAAFLVSAGISSVGVFEDLELEDSITITAHRGSSKAAPENTLAAIELAIQDGAHYAEIDVQETADGTVVLLHDTDLKRVSGLDRKIWEVDYDEIRDLDLGAGFSDEFVGERIPTLPEAIDLAGQRIALNIEIKLNGHEKNLVESVVRILEETGFESRCIVASMSRSTLARIGELNPRLNRAYLVYQKLGNIREIDSEYLMVHEPLATLLAVKAAHEAGKEIHVWTVNDATTMSLLIDRGVDGIMTDDPELLGRVLAKRAQLTNTERLILRFAELASR